MAACHHTHRAGEPGPALPGKSEISCITLLISQSRLQKHLSFLKMSNAGNLTNGLGVALFSVTGWQLVIILTGQVSAGPALSRKSEISCITLLISQSRLQKHLSFLKMINAGNLTNGLGVALFSVTGWQLIIILTGQVSAGPALPRKSEISCITLLISQSCLQKHLSFLKMINAGNLTNGLGVALFSVTWMAACHHTHRAGECGPALSGKSEILCITLLISECRLHKHLSLMKMSNAGNLTNGLGVALFSLTGWPLVIILTGQVSAVLPYLGKVRFYASLF